jgi:hypothetical protein
LSVLLFRQQAKDVVDRPSQADIRYALITSLVESAGVPDETQVVAHDDDDEMFGFAFGEAADSDDNWDGGYYYYYYYYY